MHLTNGNDRMHFYYDAQGRVSVVLFNGTAYGYVHDLQGDVIALVNASGTKVVEYTYDAWGKPTGKIGTLAGTLGTLQPFRYRGYVWDEETGLYYLRSRYYRPEWTRFVNADIIIEKNLYYFCRNEPINHVDINGNKDLTVQESRYSNFWVPPKEIDLNSYHSLGEDIIELVEYRRRIHIITSDMAVSYEQSFFIQQYFNDLPDEFLSGCIIGVISSLFPAVGGAISTFSDYYSLYSYGKLRSEISVIPGIYVKTVALYKRKGGTYYILTDIAGPTGSRFVQEGPGVRGIGEFVDYIDWDKELDLTTFAIRK